MPAASALSLTAAKAQGSGLAQLAPVDSASLHQQVYMQLRQALMSGKFTPGETLTLRAVASALGTSVMPARDAVLRLVAERALESAGRSVRVPIMTLERLRDVTRFRLALESEAAALAAERASPADIAAIRNAGKQVLQAQQKRRIRQFLVANEEFHFAVYRAAGSDLLLSMIETLWLQIGPYLGYLTRDTGKTTFMATDLGAHDALILAIERRDAVAARAALVADLEDSTDLFRPFTQAEGRAAAG